MNAKKHVATVENTEGRTEAGQTSAPRVRFGKSHVDYWSARLKKRTYIDRSGVVTEIPDWQVRLQKNRQEGWFNLGTANQAAAARKAKEIFTFLDANGWPATLAKFKPGSGTAASGAATVGEYLQAVQLTSALRLRTFLNYQNCLRTIVAGVFGIKGDAAKFDYRTGGHARWAARIDRVRLDRVTPERITEWQRRFVAASRKSPMAQASSMRTANSYVRCARSLFSMKLRKALKSVALPSVLPFDGVELFEGGSVKYVSKVNAPALIAAAKAELKKEKPEAYKAFLLGLFGGLRKAEIDLLEWAMIDWENCALRMEQTQWLHLKTEDSAGVVTVDSEMLKELRDFMPSATGAFVIESDRPARNDSARPYYRCEPAFDSLNEWLRSKGVKANKPLHELRKEIGALIATEHGIYAASQFLRHSDITTTSRHYAQHKERISVGLGKLLDTAIQPAKIQTPQRKHAAGI